MGKGSCRSCWTGYRICQLESLGSAAAVAILAGLWPAREGTSKDLREVKERYSRTTPPPILGNNCRCNARTYRKMAPGFMLACIVKLTPKTAISVVCRHCRNKWEASQTNKCETYLSQKHPPAVMLIPSSDTSRNSVQASPTGEYLEYGIRNAQKPRFPGSEDRCLLSRVLTRLKVCHEVNNNDFQGRTILCLPRTVETNAWGPAMAFPFLAASVIVQPCENTTVGMYTLVQPPQPAP